MYRWAPEIDDLQSRKMQELVKNKMLYSGWRLTEDGKSLLYNFSDGDQPSNLYMVDTDFSSKTQLTKLNPWTQDKKLTKSELIRYRDADGKELNGVLYYPVDYEEGKTYPLVCEIYEFDVFWNLTIGKDIIESVSVPKVDKFTALGLGNPYHDIHWFFQVSIGYFYKIFGWIGVSFFYILVW